MGIRPTLTSKHQIILLEEALVAAENVPVALKCAVAFEPDIVHAR